MYNSINIYLYGHILDVVTQILDKYQFFVVTEAKKK